MYRNYVFCLSVRGIKKNFRNDYLKHGARMVVMKGCTKFRWRHLKGKFFLGDLNAFQMKMIIII